MRVCVTVMAIAALLAGGACMKVPAPTQEELYARDQWAALVTEQDRETVLRQSNVHTGWSEKRKVLYQLDQFQRLARSEERKARWAEDAKKKAATRASTRAATRLTTRPTTHATTRRHRGTTGPADERDE